jgi:Ca2+-binding RTX toxin-like protein
MANVTVPDNQTNNYLAFPGVDWSGGDTITGLSNSNGLNPANGKGGLQGYGGIDTINGGGGHDYLYGFANPANFDDADTATDGGDELRGQDGDDHLFGQSGADILYPGSGSNEVDGGSGLDTVSYEDLSTSVRVFLHTLTAEHGGSTDNIHSVENVIGTQSTDTIVGDNLSNEIQALGGDDRIDGGFGFDNIDGGAGSDTVDYTFFNGTKSINLVNGVVSFPGNSTDTEQLTSIENIITDAGMDFVNGNSAANKISTGAGADELDGGAGADTLEGGSGDDTYRVDNADDDVVEEPGGGTDLVRATVTYELAPNVENLELLGSGAINGTGNDDANRTTGNSAANRLDGKGGADTMEGRGGDDTYIVDNTGDTVIEGVASGADRVRTTVTYTLPDNVDNLEIIVAGDMDASGNDIPNIITGNAENNRLFGFGAHDDLRSGPGDDYLDGGQGPDRLSGGAGDDVYVVDNSGDVVVEGENNGFDTVRSSITHELTPEVERLELTGVNAIGGTGNDLDNELVGNGASNELTGGAGDDILDGGDGNDRLDGGLGADEMRGGAGNDRYVVDVAGDTLVEAAGGGNDMVETRIAEFELDAEFERLVLAGDAVRGKGNAQANRIFGSALDNVLDGGGGNDRLFGGDGQDALRGGSGDDRVLDGGAGNDSLFGGAGSDILAGGLGRDVLRGMSGEDTFRFLTADSGVGAARDRISDFSVGIDRIDLRKVDGNLDRAGDQRLSFVGDNAFSGDAGEVRVVRNLLAADLDGDLKADFEIQISGSPTLDRNDFFL